MAEISKQKLNRKFIEQIKMMESSKVRFFTEGNYEAYRVATSLRVLLHDTRNSSSLLSQMGIKKQMRFYDVANTIKLDRYIMEKYSLIRYSLNKNPPIIFREITNETPTECFDEWCNKIVISDGNIQGNTYFTRKDIVLYLADKEGGTNVDSNYDKEKDEAYYNSTRS